MTPPNVALPGPVDDGKGPWEHGQPTDVHGTIVQEPTQPVAPRVIDTVTMQAELESKILANLVVGLATFINPQWLASQTGPSADALRLLVSSQSGLPHIQP